MGMDKSSETRGWKLRTKVILGVVCAFIIIPAVIVFSLPFIVTHVDYPEMEFALPTNVENKVSKYITRKNVSAKVKVLRGKDSDLLIVSKGRFLDWPYTLTAKTDYSLLRTNVRFDFDFSLDGTPWRITGNGNATRHTWKAKARLDPVEFSETDQVLASVLSRLPIPGVSNIVFKGSITASAYAEKTVEIPVPTWAASGRIKDLDASCVINNKSLELDGLSTSFGADGIANRMTISPLHPRIASVGYDGITVTDVSASIRKTETALLVTEAGATFCGGEVKLYSLFLDPAKLTTGFTLFLDGIDTNEIVKHLRGFRGNATGKLQGKIPVFLKNGKSLKLKNSYLYSIPGETGTLQLEDAKPILDNLAATGVDEGTTSNLAKALGNLKYKALKLDLKRDSDEGLALGLSLDGSATHGETTVPVTFSITLHGDLEQLINTGLKMK